MCVCVRVRVRVRVRVHVRVRVCVCVSFSRSSASAGDMDDSESSSDASEEEDQQDRRPVRNILYTHTALCYTCHTVLLLEMYSTRQIYNAFYTQTRISSGRSACCSCETCSHVSHEHPNAFTLCVKRVCFIPCV